MNAWIKYGFISFLVACGIVGGIYYSMYMRSTVTDNHLPVKVGLFFAVKSDYLEEQGSVDAITMAINEINAAGGILGSKIEPVFFDCTHYDAQLFEQWITHNKLTYIFAGCSCAVRRQAQEVVERLNSLLFYTNQAEGLVESPNIITLGAIPNQTIVPGVTWAFNNLGKKLYIVSSQELLSIVASEMIQQQARLLGAEIIGNQQIDDAGANVEAVVQDIVTAKPDVVLNVLSGKANIFFYKALRSANITPEDIPTLSLNSNEQELLKISEFVGDYTIASYFSTVNRTENILFLDRLKRAYSDRTVVGTNAVQCAYAAVQLWSQAVQKAKSFDKKQVVSALKTIVFNGPNGVVYLDETLYLWNPVLIGRGLFNGTFDIIWSAHDAIHPAVYPPYKSKKEWEDFLMDLYKKWGNTWSPK